MWYVGHVVGKGSYGTVYSGTLHGVQVAIKKIIYRDTGPVCDEVYASIALDHPNLVKTYVVYRRKASIHDCTACETRFNSLGEHAIDRQNTTDMPCDATHLSVWSSTSLSQNSGTYELLECFIVQARPCTTHGRNALQAMYNLDVICGCADSWEAVSDCSVQHRHNCRSSATVEVCSSTYGKGTWLAPHG